VDGGRLGRDRDAGVEAACSDLIGAVGQQLDRADLDDPVGLDPLPGGLQVEDDQGTLQADVLQHRRIPDRLDGGRPLVRANHEHPLFK